MPAFTYQAMNPQGKNLQGVLEGDSARAVRSMLRAQGLIPLQVDAVKANESQALGLNTVVFQARAFSAAALTVWTRQLASLTQAGLPLERALSALVDEAVTPRQRDVMASDGLAAALGIDLTKVTLLAGALGIGADGTFQLRSELEDAVAEIQAKYDALIDVLEAHAGRDGPAAVVVALGVAARVRHLNLAVH